MMAERKIEVQELYVLAHSMVTTYSGARANALKVLAAPTQLIT